MWYEQDARASFKKTVEFLVADILFLAKFK